MVGKKKNRGEVEGVGAVELGRYRPPYEIRPLGGPLEVRVQPTCRS